MWHSFFCRYHAVDGDGTQQFALVGFVISWDAQPRGRSTVGDFRVTHNNKCPEMLAVVRRGPFARPTSEERIEYLLTRVHKSSCGVAFAQHALEHTLSFQRRVQAIKMDFLKRCPVTPIGICHDFWDRTKIGQGVGDDKSNAFVRRVAYVERSQHV